MNWARASIEALASRYAQYKIPAYPSKIPGSHTALRASSAMFGVPLSPPSGIVQQQRSLSTASAAATEGEIVPQIPLCERQAAHTTQLTNLLTWRDQAAQRAAAVGSSWSNEPDAPSVEDLHTELSWLLDDTVVGVKSPGDTTWQQKSWRDIERSLRLKGEPSGDAEISLREPIEELGRLGIECCYI